MYEKIYKENKGNFLPIDYLEGVNAKGNINKKIIKYFNFNSNIFILPPTISSFKKIIRTEPAIEVPSIVEGA